MSRPFRFFSLIGLRGWLFLLVASATLPLTGALVWSAVETRRVMTDDAVEAMRTNLERARGALGAEVGKVMDFLALASHDKSIEPGNVRECSQRLQSLRNRITALSSLFILDVDGDRVCGFPPRPENVNVADRDYFQTARRQQDPVAGSPTRGKVSGRAILPFAAAIHPDGPGAPFAGVVAARLDIDQLLDRLRERFGLADLQLTLWTSDGVFLGRAYDAGRAMNWPLPDPALIKSLMVPSADPDAVQTFHADRRRLSYAIIAVPLPSGTLWLVADAPTAEILDAVDHVFGRTLIAATVLTALAMTLGLLLAQVALRRPILRIEAATRALEQRYLHTRIGRIGGVRELVELAGHVDNLADAIERHHQRVYGRPDAGSLVPPSSDPR